MTFDASSLPVVRIKSRRALPFFSHHPWVFAGAIGSISGTPDTGDIVVVRAHEGDFIGYGLINPASNIRVRLYSWDENEPLDDDFWRRQVESAVRFRERLFSESKSLRACRLIFSESDRLSGLTVDRYEDWLVCQWTSAALAARQEVILNHLKHLLAPKGIWLRTEKGIRELEGLDIADGHLSGEQPPETILIEENGLAFEVDLPSGQKTGFYFDQRENRQRAAALAANRRVLDICTYTGGFALACAAGGATEVRAIDSSASALERARSNAERNGVADRIEFEAGDVFEALEQSASNGERYDMIILDPPKMARTRGGLSRAIKAYIRLNRLAMTCLNPDGILVTCSCSGHVTREDFEQILAKASLESGRNLQILEQRGQAADHPVSVHCLETGYLKCLIGRVL